MILSLKAKTNLPEAYVDYIAVRTASGKQFSLNWDSSEVIHGPEYEACYKGVYFDEEYANDRCEELKGFVIEEIQVYSEAEYSPDDYFKIESIIVEDGEVIEEYDCSQMSYKTIWEG